jgi:hypothetical protein
MRRPMRRPFVQLDASTPNAVIPKPAASASQTFLDGLRSIAGDELSDSFAAALVIPHSYPTFDAMRKSVALLERVEDAVLAFDGQEAKLPALGSGELRPLIPAHATRVTTGTVSTPFDSVIGPATFSRAATNIILADPDTCYREVCRLLLYCDRLLLPFCLGMRPIGLYDPDRLHSDFPWFIRRYARLAPLIDAGLVILVPEEPTSLGMSRYRRLDVSLDLSRVLTHLSEDPMGAVPPDVQALLERQTEPAAGWRLLRLWHVVAAITDSAVMLDGLGNRGCPLIADERWVQVINVLARLAASRLTVGDANLSATPAVRYLDVVTLRKVLEVPLPGLDVGGFGPEDMRAIRDAEAFRQWRAILREALGNAVVGDSEWGSAQAAVGDATREASEQLNRSFGSHILDSAKHSLAFVAAGVGAGLELPQLFPQLDEVQHDPSMLGGEAMLVGALALVRWFSRRRKSGKTRRDA